LDTVETTNQYFSANNGEWSLLSNLSANKAEIEDRKSDIYHELAQNIVHEIVLTNKEQLDSSSSSKDLIRNVLKFPRKMRKSFSKEVKQLSENVVSDSFFKLNAQCALSTNFSDFCLLDRAKFLKSLWSSLKIYLRM